jgi:hypothetical protein
MKLETNGMTSPGKRTKHFDIKFFYFTDIIKRGEINVKYCLTDEINAHYTTKTLVRLKFIKFTNCIMDTR